MSSKMIEQLKHYRTLTEKGLSNSKAMPEGYEDKEKDIKSCKKLLEAYDMVIDHIKKVM